MAAVPVFSGSPAKPLFIDSGGGVLIPAFADDPCDCCTATLPDNLDCCSRGPILGLHCYFPPHTHRSLTLSGVVSPCHGGDPNGTYDCFCGDDDTCTLISGTGTYATIVLTSINVDGVDYCLLSGAVHLTGLTNPLASLTGVAPSPTACAGFSVSGTPFSFECDTTSATMAF